jgi:hypothetical protein
MIGLGFGNLLGGWLSTKYPGRAIPIFGAATLGVAPFGLISLRLFQWVSPFASEPLMSMDSNPRNGVTTPAVATLGTYLTTWFMIGICTAAITDKHGSWLNFSATIVLRCLKVTPTSHLGALQENR